MTRTVQLLRHDAYNCTITSAWRVQLYNYCWNQACWWPIRFENFDIVVITLLLLLLLLYDADKYVQSPPFDHTSPLPILGKRRFYSLNETFDITQSPPPSNCLVIFLPEKVICISSWPIFIQNIFHFDMGRWTRRASTCPVILYCFKTDPRFFLIFCPLD